MHADCGHGMIMAQAHMQVAQVAQVHMQVVPPRSGRECPQPSCRCTKPHSPWRTSELGRQDTHSPWTTTHISPRGPTRSCAKGATSNYGYRGSSNARNQAYVHTCQLCILSLAHRKE